MTTDETPPADEPTPSPAAPMTVQAYTHVVLLGRPSAPIEEALRLAEADAAAEANAIARELNRTLRGRTFPALTRAALEVWVVSEIVEVPLAELGSRVPVSHVVATDGTVVGRLEDGQVVQDPAPAPEPVPGAEIEAPVVRGGA